MKSMLKICTLKMLLNFIVIVQEPWKASVSEVNQITPRDGTEPRVLDVNGEGPYDQEKHWLKLNFCNC